MNSGGKSGYYHKHTGIFHTWILLVEYPASILQEPQEDVQVFIFADIFKHRAEFSLLSTFENRVRKSGISVVSQ
jgi:hypothetical protein